MFIVFLSPSLGLKSLQCCQPEACCLLLPIDILVGLGVCRASVTGSAPSRFTFQSNDLESGGCREDQGWAPGLREGPVAPLSVHHLSR